MKRFRVLAFLAALAGFTAYQGRQLHIYAASSQAPAGQATQNAGPTHGGDAAPTHASEAAAAGGALFQQNCAFCHGGDAGGGETGPDLTRSKLVTSDVGGDKIGDVVLHGRPDKGMPAFPFSADKMAQLTAFIHSEKTMALVKREKN